MDDTTITLRFFSEDDVLSMLSEWEFGSPVPAEVTDDFRKLRLIDYGEWEATLDYRRTFLEFFSELADVFGFAYKEREWAPLAKMKTTMGELAAFIAQRAEYREIKPLAILGKRCLEAGIFTAVADDVRPIGGEDCEVAPSTSIGSILDKAQRDRLALRLSGRFEDAHDERTLWYRSRLSAALGACITLCVVFGLVGGVLTHAPDWVPLSTQWALLAGHLVFWALCLLPAMAVLGVASLVNRAVSPDKGPFHPEIRSFRDLVMVLKRCAPRRPRAAL